MIWNINKNNFLLTEESDKIRNMRLAGLTFDTLPPNLRPEPLQNAGNASLSQRLTYGMYGADNNLEPGKMVPYQRDTSSVPFNIALRDNEAPVVYTTKSDPPPPTLDVSNVVKAIQPKMAAAHLEPKKEPPVVKTGQSHASTPGMQSKNSGVVDVPPQPVASTEVASNSPWYQDTLDWMGDNKLATAGIIGAPLALAGSYLLYKKLKNKK